MMPLPRVRSNESNESSSSDSSAPHSPVDLINRANNLGNKDTITIQQSPLANELSGLVLSALNQSILESSVPSLPSLGPPALPSEPVESRSIIQSTFSGSQFGHTLSQTSGQSASQQFGHSVNQSNNQSNNQPFDIATLSSFFPGFKDIEQFQHILSSFNVSDVVNVIHKAASQASNNQTINQSIDQGPTPLNLLPSGPYLPSHYPSAEESINQSINESTIKQENRKRSFSRHVEPHSPFTLNDESISKSIKQTKSQLQKPKKNKRRGRPRSASVSAKQSNKQSKKHSTKGRKKVVSSDSDSDSDSDDDSIDQSSDESDNDLNDESFNQSIKQLINRSNNDLIDQPHESVAQATVITSSDALLHATPAPAIELAEDEPLLSNPSLDKESNNQSITPSQQLFLQNFDPSLRHLLTLYASKQLKPFDQNNVWTCFLSHLRMPIPGQPGDMPLCTKCYQKSSRRSFKKHLWKCLISHFPVFSSLTYSVFRRLCLADPYISAGFGAVCLFPRAQRPRRSCSELAEAETWRCPLQCGQVYRNTSSTSISRHVSKECRFKDLTEEQREKEREKERILLKHSIVKSHSTRQVDKESSKSNKQTSKQSKKDRSIKSEKPSKSSNRQSLSETLGDEPILKRSRTSSPPQVKTESISNNQSIKQQPKSLEIDYEMDSALRQSSNPPNMDLSMLCYPTANQPIFSSLSQSINQSNNQEFDYHSAEVFRARQSIRQLVMMIQNSSKPANMQSMASVQPTVEVALTMMKAQMYEVVHNLSLNQLINQDYQSISSVLFHVVSDLPDQLQQELVAEVTARSIVVNQSMNQTMIQSNNQMLQNQVTNTFPLDLRRLGMAFNQANQFNNQSTSQSINQSSAVSPASHSPSHAQSMNQSNNPLNLTLDLSPMQMQTRLFPQSMNQTQSINSTFTQQANQSNNQLMNPMLNPSFNQPINPAALQFFTDSPSISSRAIFPITPVNQSNNPSGGQFLFNDNEFFNDFFGRQYANMQSINQPVSQSNQTINQSKPDQEEKEAVNPTELIRRIR